MKRAARVAGEAVGSVGSKPRLLKAVSICRDRKLGDHSLIVAFRTSSHRIGNILCCCLVVTSPGVHSRTRGNRNETMKTSMISDAGTGCRHRNDDLDVDNDADIARSKPLIG